MRKRAVLQKAMKLVIVGSGGHARVIIDAIFATNLVLLGLLDDFAKPETQFDGHPILGTIRDYVDKGDFRASIFVAVGNNAEREKIVARLPSSTHFLDIL